MNYREINLNTWPRKEHFWHFTTKAKCSISITKNVDVTQLRVAAKASGDNFYIALLYIVTKVLNRHSEFKLAWLEKEKKLIEWNEIIPAHLVFHKEDETFTCIFSKWIQDYAAFRDACREDIAAGKAYRGYQVPGIPENTFCVSCLPWLHYSSLDINLYGNEIYLAPMISWGKFEELDGQIMLPLSFEIHHAAADGFHIARFYDEVEWEAKCLAAAL